MYDSLLHGSLSSAYNDMVSAAQKAKTKKSLSAWSLATKLTGSHISLSSKQKKPPAEETQGEMMFLLIVLLSYINDRQPAKNIVTTTTVITCFSAI